jgi:hypothetical protein
VRLGTEDWERLPDSEIISSSPWYSEGDLLVNPQLGGADGGEVGNWGRTYPRGGVLNTRTETWTDLPQAASESSAGVVGASGGLIYTNCSECLLLDLVSMSWIDMPAIPSDDAESYSRRTVVPAGRNAVAFGGQRWVNNSEGELLGDAWIWRTRSSSDASSTEAPPTSDGSAAPGSVAPPTIDPLCAELDGTELVVGSHVLTRLPEGFAPNGGVDESSTGAADAGGESHAVQRFTDPDGRWIEFDSLGMEHTNAYIQELTTGVATEEVSYPTCVFPVTGPELTDYRIAVARLPGRTVLGAQEWEFGGFALTGGPDVPTEALLSIASGLRTRWG